MNYESDATLLGKIFHKTKSGYGKPLPRTSVALRPGSFDPIILIKNLMKFSFGDALIFQLIKLSI